MPAINPFNDYDHGNDFQSPARSIFAITPNNSSDMATVVRMIFVGVGGNVSVIDTTGNTAVHKNVASGSYIGPFRVARVTATNTTATDLIGYV